MVKQFNIQELISKPFDRADYIRFIKTLFEIKPENQLLEVTGQYSEYINSGEYLGDYELNREKIHFYIINLKNKSVERARVFQRNFIAGDLRNHGAENALVVFYNDDQWRISFVKRERVEGKEQQLSAKRYSFFVGENEINNTCVQRINLLLKKDKPAIKDIEEAFSVEKVKDEFFKEYKSLFDDLYKEIKRLRSSDNLINEEFTEKNISEEDFAKKILGQIVFLYFLQKKGWLGIERDPVTKKFREFGEGDQNFLQKLFNIAKERKKNFFNDYLEKLFYKALADSSRKADNYEFEIDGNEWKIPFLNGGLFEPIGEYDWKRTDIKIDDGVFKKVLETFNKYNFTIREDEPMEKEVAIDPEMLGKVFENLLETKERKSTGSFYTPREIVHYMCQQSLINYLETNTNITREVLDKFVTEDCSLELPKEVEVNSVKLDELLQEIKIVDPAVGSGAFLVGMMTEIVKARSYLNKDKKIFDLKEECIENNLHGVDISPGAVDICQLRLWLSLVVDEENYGNVKPLPNLDYKIMCGNSLIEDYKGMKIWDDKWIGIEKIGPTKQEQIKQIDIKIRECKAKMPYLINKKNEKKNLEKQIRKLEKEKKEMMKGNGRNLELFMSESTRKLELLKSLHEKFTHINDRAEKQEYKKKIETATIELIKSKLKEEGKESEFEDLKQIIQKKRAIPFFLWKMNFIDVFQRENPGFDVVIANPPYVPITTFPKEIKETLLKNYSELGGTFSGKIDLYAFFILLSFKKLLKRDGNLNYIIPKTILSNISFTELRRHITEKYQIDELTDLEKVFEQVTGTMTYLLLSVLNKKNADSYSLMINNMDLGGKIQRSKISIDLLKSPPSFIWVLSKQKLELIRKIEKDSEHLSKRFITKNGVCTGSNSKFLSGKKENNFYRKIKVAKDISKYHIKPPSHYVYYKRELLHRPREEEIFIAPKIIAQMIRGLNTSERLICALDFTDELVLNNINIIRKRDKLANLKFLLAMINSETINFYFKTLVTDVNIKTIYLDQIPIKKISPAEQKPFIEKVDQILNITKDEDYLTNDSKKEKVKQIEKEIDKMVYELYELTPGEIKIVEESGK